MFFSLSASLAFNLSSVQMELENDSQIEAVVKGSNYVIHCAAPVAFVLTEEDARKKLLEPMRNGVLSVCNHSKATGVSRIVLTSCIFTMTEGPVNGVKFSEDDVNTGSSLSRNPYFFAKTQSERAAIDWCAENGQDLCGAQPDALRRINDSQET